MDAMGWFRNAWSRSRRKASIVKDSREVDDALLAYLTDFTRTRQGVEAWVEAGTNLNKPSLLLIAHDGEWTRRSVPSTAWAHDFAARLQVPAYDAGIVAYPQRMRDWDARRRGK